MDPLDLLAGWEIVDISLPLATGLPVWPGDPPFLREAVATVERDGYALTRLHLTTHTGTHVDPAAHMLAGGATLDAVPLGRWIGRCRVVAIPDDAPLVTAAHLEAAAIPAGVTRLLLKTRNSARWAAGPQAFDTAAVALGLDAARWCVARGIALVGIDGLSIEAYPADPPVVHHELLGHGIIVLEGLDLSAIAPGDWALIALPLQVAAGDGAPARAILARPGATAS
jgi:arylformamidase